MSEKYIIKSNVIYNADCISGMSEKIENESIDLIIADPPYFKVIGEKWDYLWRTEEDYLEWSKKWIAEASRVLRKGGSFYLFGYYISIGTDMQRRRGNGCNRIQHK